MKNALITGATKGIGKAIAVALAKEGFNLAICSRNIEDLTATAREINEMNPQIAVYTQITDCSYPAEVRNFAQKAQEILGDIHVLINNVGTFIPASILDEEEGILEKQWNLNFLPAYELYRFFGKKMQKAQEGHIFNICSVASISPISTAGSYSVTKLALYGLSKIMSDEMQPYKVKVTAIIPGSTLTSSWEGTDLPENNFVMPQDIASIVVNCLKMSPGAHLEEVHIRPVTGQV
jgi:short-subunit dehydrogenase